MTASPTDPSTVQPKPLLIFAWLGTDWGGAQIYMLAIMKEAKDNWDVLVILPCESSRDILDFIDAIGVTREFIDVRLDSHTAVTIPGRFSRQWARIRSEGMLLKRLLSLDLRCAILHIEIAPWQSWQMFLTLLLRGANVFVTFHNAIPAGFPRWRRLVWKARLHLLSRFSRFHVFTSNKDTKKQFAEYLTPRCWNDIAVTYTCVNPPEIERARAAHFHREAALARFGITPGKAVVLCVGQFIDRKGRWVFLEAARSICESSDDFVFVWVTPVAASESESRRIESYNLGSRFRLVRSGEIGTTRHEILQFFRVGDIFALPSLLEGLPIALLEAMALGIPSISTRINAIPEALIDQKTGLLIKPNDSAALAAAILRLDRDAPLRDRVSLDGSKFVMQNFDERVASRIALTAYDRALNLK